MATLCRIALPCVLLGTIFAQQPADYEFLLASAQQAQARGDFEAAAGLYRQASTLHPEIAELKANLGLMYYQTNKDEQAAEVFQQTIRLNPELFVPNLFLGLDYLRLKRPKEAIPYLKHAARLKPDDIHVHIGLGEAYSAVGDMHLAIRSYAMAAESDPDNAEAWYRLGMVYLEQVEADARILLSRHKDSGFTQALAAENFAEQRAFNEAAVSYQRALSVTPFPPGTRAGYGFVLLNHDDLAGAERELKSELAANPGSLLAKLGMARLEVEQGAAEQGAKQIAEIWKADAGFLTLNAPQLNTGLAQAKRDELQNALNRLQASGELSEQAISLFGPETPQGTVVRSRQPEAASLDISTAARSSALQLYSTGAYRQCSDLLASRLAALSPKDLGLLAFCAYGTGDYEHAFDAAEKLSTSPSTGIEALYWETKSSEKLAANALTRASQIDSSSPHLHVLLGDIYRQQQLLPEAEQEYRRALILRPGDTGAVFGLSLALLDDSHWDEAFQVAQAAVNENPNDPELNAVMGEILCDRAEFSGAEKYLKKSLNTKPEYVSHVHALLGKVYANTNRDQQALAELKIALPDDKDGSLHYQIGRLYMKLGDRNSAQRAFLESRQIEEAGLRKPLKDLRPGQDDKDPQ